jgi:hypothetical protein
MVLVFTLLPVSLGICYWLADSRDHIPYWGYQDGLPAISNLGDYEPEHSVFAAAFCVTALLLAFASTFRVGQLDHIDSRAFIWVSGSVRWTLVLYSLDRGALFCSRGLPSRSNS